MNETEKRFEEFIENYLISEKGADGQRHGDAGYCSDESKDMFLDIVTLTDFVKRTQVYGMETLRAEYNQPYSAVL